MSRGLPQDTASKTRFSRSIHGKDMEGPLKTIVWVHACLNDTTQVEGIVGVPVDCERDH